jgi:cytochrome c553
MALRESRWRSLVFGLAAAAVYSCAAVAQGMPLNERIAQCAACHGDDGNSRMERVPSLAGQPEFFLANQLILMREKVRPVEAMMPFVQDLSDADISALAKHFSKLEPKPSDEPVDPALVERGVRIAEARRCGSCHMPDLSGHEQMPRLAKQRIDYMIEALIAFRDDKRPGADTLMTVAVLGLSDEELAALAHYAASR